MNVQRTQGYGMSFGVNYAEILRKNGISVISHGAGKAIISGAVNNETGRKISMTIFGKDLSSRVIYDKLRQEGVRFLAEG